VLIFLLLKLWVCLLSFFVIFIVKLVSPVVF
jgi:hypothetical protein